MCDLPSSNASARPGLEHGRVKIAAANRGADEG